MKYQLLRLISFNPTITRQMHPASTGSLLLGWLTVLFVASASAGLFAATFSRLCFGGEHYWMLFGIWFLLIWILDSVVLRSLGSNLVMGIRIAIVGVIALLNSFTFDELLFRRDISNFLEREYQKEVARVDSTSFSGAYLRLREDREDLVDRNIQLDREVEASRMYVLKEWLGEAPSGEEGRGEKYEAKKGKHLADSTAKYTERAANADRIMQLDKEIDLLDRRKADRIAALVKPKDSGLRDNVNALHRLIFGPDGKPMDKLYFMLLFALGVILESLVIIVKPALRSAVADYHRISKEAAKQATDQAISRMKGKGAVVELRDQLECQQSMNELTSKVNRAAFDHHASLSVEEIEGRIRKAVLEDDAIAEAIVQAQHRNADMKEAFGELLYEVFGQELNDLELAAVRKELERLARQRRDPAKKEPVQ